MVYEIKEYSSDSDKNNKEIFTKKDFPIFYIKRKVIQYIQKNKIYGKIFVYDEQEYALYNNDDEKDLDCEIEMPKILEELDTKTYLK